MKMIKKDAARLKNVVAAVIERDGRVLIARRREGTRSGGFWEFPGGKVEDGEMPEKALEREFAEELGLRITSGEHFLTVEYRGALPIKLMVYRAELVSGEVTLTDHDSVRWAAPAQLKERDFTGPDRPVVRRLKKNDGKRYFKARA